MYDFDSTATGQLMKHLRNGPSCHDIPVDPGLSILCLFTDRSQLDGVGGQMFGPYLDRPGGSNSNSYGDKSP